MDLSVRRSKTKVLVAGGDPQETVRVKGLIGFVDGQTTLQKIGAVHRVVGLHVPSRKLTVHDFRYYGFTIIDVCRNAIAQAAPSGASRLESLRRPFLRITDSTATTEPQL
jgi:hypothetical protein